MNTQEIDALLEDLKNAREENAAYRHSMNAMLEAMKLNPDYVNASAVASVWAAKIVELEAQIKSLALEEYATTGEKKPHEKIQIKIFKVFKIIDPKKVFDFAMQNIPAAFKIDEKKIEKYAFEFGDVDGTEKGEEARVQIASEL